jgi:hypothetical protein
MISRAIMPKFHPWNLQKIVFAAAAVNFGRELQMPQRRVARKQWQMNTRLLIVC